MILCSCTVITDHDIRHAQTRGARTPKDVYRLLGKKPRCGSCAASLVEVLSEPQHTPDYALAKPA